LEFGLLGRELFQVVLDFIGGESTRAHGRANLAPRMILLAKLAIERVAASHAIGGLTKAGS
jgi:hypothetical protein